MNMNQPSIHKAQKLERTHILAFLYPAILRTIAVTIPTTGTQINNRIAPTAYQDCAPSSKIKFFKGNKLVAATPTPNNAATRETPTIAKMKYTKPFIAIVIILPT